MKPSLKPGLAHTRKITVDEPRVINFMGDDCRVYATPRIISDVDGRRVTFEAAVNDGDDAVARGTHERFVVDVQKVRERLLKKKAQRS
jgi:predicted thioesterase